MVLLLYRRISHTSKALLDLIEQFPMKNPSHADATEPETEDGMDILKLFGQIRSRYKLLCTLVGVRPSLRAASSVSASSAQSISTIEVGASIEPGVTEDDSVSVETVGVKRSEGEGEGSMPEVEKKDENSGGSKQNQVRLKTVRRVKGGNSKKGNNSVWAVDYPATDNPGGVDYSF